jgi:hypothetical protein
MPVHGNDSGWQEIPTTVGNIDRRGASSWSDKIVSVNVKVSSTWYPIWPVAIPDSAVIAYTNVNSNVPTGASSQYLTSDRFILGYNTTGIIASGDTSHLSGDHPSLSGTITDSDVNHVRLKDRAVGQASFSAYTANKHNHANFTFNLSAIDSHNVPKRSRWQFPFRQGGEYLTPGMILFANGGSISWSKWAKTDSYDGRYLACGNVTTPTSQNDGTGLSHTHTGTSERSAYSSASGTTDLSVFSGYSYYDQHRHSVSIAVGSGTYGSNYQYIQAYILNDYASFSELPVGTVIFCSGDGSDFPAGWNRWSAVDDKVFYITSTSTSAGGSWTHSHSVSITGATTQDWTAVRSVERGSDVGYGIAGHASSHSFTTTLTSMGNATIRPPHYRTRIMKKDS